ncbi:MAG: hypothetical protein ACREPM_09470 [Gemmatimonadaceae bacterium]
MKWRRVAWIAGAAVLVACRQRTVEVRTSPTPPQQSQVSVQVANSLTQAVNVYVTANGNDTFLRQVAAKTTTTIPVQGFAAGATVGLKAVTVDNARTYQRQNVVLTGTYVFPLP